MVTVCWAEGRGRKISLDYVHLPFNIIGHNHDFFSGLWFWNLNVYFLRSIRSLVLISQYSRPQTGHSCEFEPVQLSQLRSSFQPWATFIDGVTAAFHFRKLTWACSHLYFAKNLNTEHAQFALLLKCKNLESCWTKVTVITYHLQCSEVKSLKRSLLEDAKIVTIQIKILEMN